MNLENNSWQRLVAMAREAPGPGFGSEEAPVGFATRVVAQAWAADRSLEWMTVFVGRGWRALLASAAIAAICVGLNYAPVMDSINNEVVDAAAPVTALLDY